MILRMEDILPSFFQQCVLYISILSSLLGRDADGAIVRPLPRAKRMLSEATCLPHLVQV